jgi:hypothetical protein
MLIVLTIMWLINGIGYHIMFFSVINPIAKVFGGLFVLQAVLYIMEWLRLRKTDIIFDSGIRQTAGWIITAYGMIFYSLIGYLIGHVYPAAPVFGVAPCPTTIFTLGILLVMGNNIRNRLFIIPCLWAVIGSMAAFKLGIKEDLGLLLSAVIAVILILRKQAKHADNQISA